jgi:hypothetical protein
MKGKTKTLTQQVQAALLALPNDILMQTIAEWLDLADEQLAYLDWSDEFRYALGYRVQSDETEKIYASFDELYEAEPDGMCASWVIPKVDELRYLLSNLPVEEFYHTVISIAGHALSQKAHEESWGYPPSVLSDGYDFMRCLAVHVRSKTLLKPTGGHLPFVQEAVHGRKKMYPDTSVPTFITRRLEMLSSMPFQGVPDKADNKKEPGKGERL